MQLLQLHLHRLHLCLTLCHTMACGVAQLVELHLQPLGFLCLRLDAGVHNLLGLANLHLQLADLCIDAQRVFLPLYACITFSSIHVRAAQALHCPRRAP